MTLMWGDDNDGRLFEASYHHHHYNDVMMMEMGNSGWVFIYHFLFFFTN